MLIKNEATYDVGYDIYPGGYVPVLNEEEVENYIHQPHKNEFVFPVVNMTELNDSYKVELVIPGVRREDFFIRSHDNTLSVCVIHKDIDLNDDTSLVFCSTDYECVDRDIILPENADPEFMSAEYRDGTLCMYAPKTKKPIRHSHSTVVVY